MITGFLTVRIKSSRLPNKCLLKFGDKTVLDYVIRRAIHYKINPIVCTTSNKEDDRVEEIAAEYGVKCFRGAVRNKLKRWRDCCEEYKIEKFHSIDVDNPFFCGDEIKRSYSLLESQNLDIVEESESSSDGEASVGFTITKDFLNRICGNLDEDSDTEMIWNYYKKLDGIRVKKLDDNILLRTNARLTLDYHEDYIMLSAIKLITNEFPDRQEIQIILQNNPSLREINYFRNRDFKKNQENSNV